jgi:hypothetical protein
MHEEFLCKRSFGITFFFSFPVFSWQSLISQFTEKAIARDETRLNGYETLTLDREIVTIPKAYKILQCAVLHIISKKEFENILLS